MRAAIAGLVFARLLARLPLKQEMTDNDKCESYDLTDWGQPFEKAVRDLPELSDKAVLVRVTAAGLCHSDLHIKKGFMDLVSAAS